MLAQLEPYYRENPDPTRVFSLLTTYVRFLPLCDAGLMATLFFLFDAIISLIRGAPTGLLLMALSTNDPANF